MLTLIAGLAHVFHEKDILDLQQLVQKIHTSDAVLEYILDLAEETRKGRQGLSTRGVLSLKKAAQAYALIEQRGFVTPDDVQAVFGAVVAHRIGATEAEVIKLMHQVSVA